VLVLPALLVAGIIGGLLRAGVAVPLPGEADWPGRAVLGHAFLVICGFLGSVIGLERAVAARARYAYAAPAFSALAGTCQLAGAPAAASWLAVAGALLFMTVNVMLLERQRAAHTYVLVAGALGWFIGNLLLATGAPAPAIVPWWLSFLVLTIAAERLEMTRLMRRRRGAAPALYACLGALVLGSAGFTLSPVAGGLLYGLALFGLALWLAVHDIARRTVAARGLSRYMAVCLLLGYAWLAVSGLAWMATALGYAVRDVALHALGLGFVFGMMFAHAPVILPALTRVKILFGGYFYVPLALLHASLLVRLALGPFDFAELGRGAIGNACAIAAFAATVLGAAVAWRLRFPVDATHLNPE
jgi:hypothetical protein